jgi:hypothetical protein
MALNRAGQILSLPGDEQVALVRKLDAPPPKAGAFGDCDDAVSTFDTLENGVYLLVMGPASGFRERVPMRGLSDTAGVTECGSRYRIEGVQFRLARLQLSAMTGLSQTTQTQINDLMSAAGAANLSKLRNLLAHVCLGTDELATLAREPFKQSQSQSAYASYGAADFLRARGELTDCEVPLALLYWRGGTLRFADMWSVRRRVTPRVGVVRFPPLLEERRAIEGEATIRQFEEHAESLRANEPFPEFLVASNLFRYLPPAGILPLRQGASKGFSENTFFAGLACRVPEYIDGALLRRLMREAADYGPIDLTDKRMLWLYKVAENEALPGGGAAPAPYLVFAAPHVPYKATPRFDVARWDLSNYTKCGECES